MNILIVEDDFALRTVWEDALLDSGHRPTGVSSAPEAMRALMTDRFDVVVLDLLLSDGNSLSLTHYISYAMPSVPVIVVTGSGFFPHGDFGAITPNIDWLLRKPLPIADFVAMVDHAGCVAAERKAAAAAPVETPQYLSL
ncbi:MAG: response regulator [Pseudomonadota bacterium]